LATLVVLALTLAGCDSAYYLPGVTPQTYQQYENVKLFVMGLTSTKTQMPYDYYSLPYCKPSKLGLQSENVGEALSGDRVENSVYKVWRHSRACVCIICISDTCVLYEYITRSNTHTKIQIHTHTHTHTHKTYDTSHFTPVTFSSSNFPTHSSR